MIYWGHPARKGVRACITIIYRRWPAGPADRVKDRREPRALEDDKACVGRELVGVQSNSERVVSRWKTCRQKYPRCHIPEIHQVTAIVSGRRPGSKSHPVFKLEPFWHLLCLSLPPSCSLPLDCAHGIPKISCSRVGCEHPNCPDSFQLPHQLFIFISTVMPFSYRRLFFGGTTFCCCLPVRLGVIVMSSLGCLVAGILMILLWFELASTSQSSLGFIRCYISKYSILILLSDIVHDDPRTRGICSRCVDSDSPFCSVHSRVRFPGIKDCYKIKN